MYKIPAITLFLGRSLKFVPECQSTNDLMQLICQQEQLAEGSVIITANQVAGRGQRGNTWEAEPGRNLTFSIYLRPAFLSVSDQFFLNIFVSLGVLDFLTMETGKKVQIKWPNDILLETKKICGILIENQLVGTKLGSSVIGVGFNVNQQQFSVPTASSLAIATNRDWNLQYVFEQLLKCLEVRYLQLREGRFALLREEYLKNLFRINQEHMFTSTNGAFRGTITGIDEIGRLKISKGGSESSYDVKEIKFAGW